MLHIVFFILAHLSFGPNLETGEITGTVYDNKNHSTLPGVHISLHQDKELIHESFSDIHGTFSFPKIPAGNYEITFNFVGKRKKKISDVQIKSGQILELEIIYPRVKKVNRK